MHVSSRWCVTAVLALGALSCSDPVAPPAQGAFIATVSAVSPAMPGKFCPVPASSSFDVPSIRETMQDQVLTENRYLHKVVDGEGGAGVRCSVKAGGGGFTFSGKITAGVRALEISSGTLGADKKGTARFVLANSQGLSSPLASQMADCTVNAAAMGSSFQVDKGHMWASFRCTAVEAPPTEYCQADGIFVLENCDQ